MSGSGPDVIIIGGGNVLGGNRNLSSGGFTGTLPIANGGTGGKTAAEGRTNLGLANPTYPLMNYGGLNFNGTTTYLDGNAMTGIADGKKGMWVGLVRFANAASATEVIRDSTGQAFRLFRSATGTLVLTAENAGGTGILNIQSASAACAVAGAYAIMFSWDLAVPGSGRGYVNDVSSYVEVTFTDDTIDYTVTENGLGATVGGASFFAGDMYLVWFDATTNLEFNTESERRKFFDSNNVAVFLGSNGELPTGSIPTAFNAYGNGSTAGRASWVRDRGSNTGTYVENGAIAAPAVALSGQQAPLSGRYTPALTNVANLTSTAFECQYFRDSSAAGGIQTVSGKVNVDPTLAATSTQLGISLPFASALTAAEQCAGTSAAPGIAGQVAAILGDATNDRAQMQWISADVTAQDMYFHLMAKTI